MQQKTRDVLISSLLLLPPIILALTVTFMTNFFFPLNLFLHTIFFCLFYFMTTTYLLIMTSYSKKLSTYLNYLTTPGLVQIRKEKTEYDQKSYILENISEGICAINPEGLVVYYNQKFFKKFIKPWKLTSDTSISIDTIFQNHEDLKQAFNRVIRLQTNETIRQVLHQHKSRDLYFDVAISGIIKDVENFAAAIGVFHDVTEKRLTDLMRANFVANISHEIRTPLTSILGFTEVLENKFEHQQEVQVSSLRPYLKPIIQNAIKLKKLFSDLLTLSLIESERKITKGAISLEELFDQQIYFLSANYPQKKVQVKKNIQFDIIDVDRELFQQVLTNLIDNSLKYTQSEQVHLTLDAYKHATDSDMIIKISDNNPALPASELERIFERFYRLDIARNIHQGSGIGLSIVKQIMSKHKGRAYAENQDGKTYFCLRLPLAKPN